MTIKLYGLKNCDKCRAALKDLNAAGRDVTFVDIRENTPTADVLETWVASCSADKILNTRSTTWRGLSNDERAYQGDAGLVELLLNHPTLIKRPVVATNDQVIVGWNNKIPI